MANLAQIFSSEQDKVNCSFWFKVGACRHGDQCSRLHVRPHFSETLLLKHFYMPPPPNPDGSPAKNAMDHYEDFYEDVLREVVKFGSDVEELLVCENLGDHMFGNTYVKFGTEEQAEQALKKLNGRYYAGRQVHAEYNPVTNFREGRCRHFDESTCQRGDYCNFLHLRPVPRFARKYLSRPRFRFAADQRFRRHRERDRRGRSRSPTGRKGKYWFPIRGTSPERRAIIEEWNRELDKQRARDLERREAMMAEAPAAPIAGAHPGAPSFVPPAPGMPPMPMGGPPPPAAPLGAPGPYMNPERLARLGTLGHP